MGETNKLGTIPMTEMTEDDCVTGPQLPRNEHCTTEHFKHMSETAKSATNFEDVVVVG